MKKYLALGVLLLATTAHAQPPATPTVADSATVALSARVDKLETALQNAQITISALTPRLVALEARCTALDAEMAVIREALIIASKALQF